MKYTKAFGYADRRNVEQLASYAAILEKRCELLWRANVAANPKERLRRALDQDAELIYESLNTPLLLRRQAG